jgi:hypothetical protein
MVTLLIFFYFSVFLGNTVSLPASEILPHGAGVVVEVEQLHSGFCINNFCIDRALASISDYNSNPSGMDRVNVSDVEKPKLGFPH